LKTIKVIKGQILQREGDVALKVYHVKSGLLRSFSIDHKGKEHVFMFAPENWIVGDAIKEGMPCTLFIDVLEDSELEVRDRLELDPNADIKPLYNRIAVLQNRIIMLMSATAIERYEHFVDTYPNIIQRVPQRMVASYLGITPEALSKVKGDKYRGK
jgi:CRP-like cAMP-binding protein